MKFAIIIATPPHSVYFLTDEEGETKYFQTLTEAENWIQSNRRSISDYFVWDVSAGCIY
jgi:hypothetical protein